MTNEKARQRLRMCERLMLDGMCVPRDLADALGVTTNTVHKYQKLIWDKWKNATPDNEASKRARTIQRLERITYLSIQAFHRSAQSQETRSVRREPRKCQVCRGKEEDCIACDGQGVVQVEIETVTSKESAGDSSFLTVARQSLKDISVLEGLTQDTTTKRRFELDIQAAEGSLAAKLQGITSDKLIRIRMMMEDVIQDADPQDEMSEILDAVPVPRLSQESEDGEA